MEQATGYFDCTTALLLRQDHLVNSRYNQLIKAHRVGFSEIKDFESTITHYKPDFDYMLMVDRWSSVFGRENIFPIIYDKHSSSIEKLLSHSDFPEATSGFQLPADNPNPALDFEAVKTLRCVKQLCTDKRNLMQLVTVAHRLLEGKFVDTYTSGDQYLLPISTRNEIYQHYQDSNSALKMKYFPDRESLFPQLESTETTNDSTQVNWEMVLRIFHEAGLALPESKGITICF